MTKKIILLKAFLLFMVLSATAQNDYYYYNGKKIVLQIDSTKLDVYTDRGFDLKNINSNNFSILDEQDRGNYNLKTIKRNTVKFKESVSKKERSKKIKTFVTEKYIKNYAHYYKRGNSKAIGTSNIFHVKLKTESDFDKLQRIAGQNKATIIEQNEFMPLWYTLRLNKDNSKTSVALTNLFYETGLFAAVDPAFRFNFQSANCPDDPMFGSQWGLNNSNNPNVDINACDAWCITQGQGVKVAVVDKGIDTSHLDLGPNIHTASYDAQTGTSPSIFNPNIDNFDHGTHVAGIVGAVKGNNIDVVGVAPQSQIVPVSHDLFVTGSIAMELANGINWAAHIAQVDVINCSWGDQGGQFFSNFHSSALEDAIDSALYSGRNGLGCIVVFASGNQGDQTGQGFNIDYPASYNMDILCVGASTQSGLRRGSSSYGIELDVVAPGDVVMSTIPNNGTGPKSGTSMAAPHVAGIAALLLSVNPSLTRDDVVNIIESTAVPIGPYSYSTQPGRQNPWNNEMGFGLVDAHAALLTQGPDPGCQPDPDPVPLSIDGSDIICNSNEAYTLSGVPFGSTVVWEHSSNVDEIGPLTSNTQIVVQSNLTPPYSPFQDRSGFVRATVNGETLQFDFWVGPTNPIVTSYDPSPSKIYMQWDDCVVYFGDQADQIAASAFNPSNFEFRKPYTDDFDWDGPYGNVVPMWCISQAPYLSLNFEARLKNQCGWGEWKPFSYFLQGYDPTYPGGFGFSMYSASNTDDLTIEIQEDELIGKRSIKGNDKGAKLDRPADGKVTKESYNIYIVDIYGRVKYQRNGIKDKKVKIKKSNWPQGVYYVRVSNGKNDSQTKGFALNY